MGVTLRAANTRCSTGRTKPSLDVTMQGIAVRMPVTNETSSFADDFVRSVLCPGVRPRFSWRIPFLE